ncbi:MAG: Glu-tRNA(Gln) amidotransferase subunit GatE [Promethearchaeia archaeon]
MTSLETDILYSELGLKVGLEIHQQLDTRRKLYCHCSPVIQDDEPDGGFMRRLRPTQSEMGEIDPAALFEFQRGISYYYEYYNDTTCLVETDEEPPHSIDEESIETTLMIAIFLQSTPVDEIHPMRKIVIDGSNTAGFQRTAVIAQDGRINLGEKEIGIQTICLEEDAARKMSENEDRNIRVYRLDRLGIPLIEISTAPDIATPDEAKETAFALGLLLRSTGKAKRGIGTIRQDVNVSIEDGAVTEIKGLQELDLLADVVRFEALRQYHLLQIAATLEDRGVTSDSLDDKIVDATSLFQKTESSLIKSGLDSGEGVYAVKLPGFAGILGSEIQPARRFGTELSDYAKFWGGVGGIFHTDEMPNYGISENEVASLRDHLDAKKKDAVVFVVADQPAANDSLSAVIDRSKAALKGVPEETRIPLPSGASRYARPRPGAERMYPETDVRPVKVTDSKLEEIRSHLPETLDKKKDRFMSDYELSAELASQLTMSPNADLFEEILDKCDVAPTLVAVTLENTLVNLKRNDVPVESLDDNDFLEVFEIVESEEVSPEAIPDILSYLANNPAAEMGQALTETGLGRMETAEAQEIVRRIVEERKDFVLEQKKGSIGGLMGVAMKELRGKVDGSTVKDLLLKEIERNLEKE